MLTVSALSAFVFILSCASPPPSEPEFNYWFFSNVAKEKAKESPRRFSLKYRIVLDPESDSKVYETLGDDGPLAAVLASRGLGIMVPIMIPQYGLGDDTILSDLPLDGSSYGIKIGIRDYASAMEDGSGRAIVTNVVLCAEVFDPSGSPLFVVTGSGEGRRTAMFRVHEAAETSCAYALGDALDDLVKGLTTDHPELDFLIR